ncbi:MULTISPECIES: ribonuclease R [Rhodomicrobium]|uniref:ribonuclease R n=1 Tax=Rhodomicrobium TaxID=1068 RepID=UPI000B4AF88B|nr:MULTISPECIES: ribonuclease R [Rhodomicrobium]
MKEGQKSGRKAKARGGTAPPLPSKDAILEFIRTSPVKVGKREIARAFGLKGDDRILLKELLRELTASGRITKTRKRVRGTAQLRSVTVVEVSGNDANGELIAIPLDWNEASEGPPPRILMRLKPGRMPGIGDHVLSRIEPVAEPDGFDYTAMPIKILPRERTRQLGIFRKVGDGGVIEPTDKKQLREWRLGPSETEGAKDGELVRFEVTKTGQTLAPRARIIERLGHPEGERAISMIAIENYSLPNLFPASVEAEIAGLKPPTLRGREDLRKLPLITIDPADAKDHDDAVWAGPDEDASNKGGFVVIVAIADVSYYVRPGTALSAEALKRGNSVYFPDQVVPMLPEALSNDLCSLKQGVERPCLAVRMVFSADGHKRDHRFARAMMRSAAKLAYPEAQAAIDGQPNEHSKPLLEPVLRPLWAAYEALRRARNKRGPLELDLPERKIILDEEGRVARVITPERLDAHRLIEEFMIQANVAAAETLEQVKSPLLYRIHDAPGEEKLNSLVDFLATLGISLPKGVLMQPSQFNRILDKMKDSDVSELVNEVILRSQAQAEYSPNNLGHFGLNLRRYAHFTSPIRRYADLIVHRSLIRSLKLGPGGLADEEIAELDSVAEQISQAERRAMSAERETVDRLIAIHLASRIGATFPARISGVTRSGLFVKLNENGADGFIPASTIGRDYYIYSEADHAMIGERSGEAFRLGDKVEVKLVEAHPSAGALRFTLVSDGRFDLKLSRRKRGPAPGRHARRRR